MFRSLIVVTFSILLIAGCAPSRLTIRPAEVHNPDSVTKSVASRLLEDIQGTWIYKEKRARQKIEIKGNQWTEKWGGNAYNPEDFELELTYGYAGDTITMSPAIILENRQSHDIFTVQKITSNKFVLKHFDEKRVYRRKK